MIPFSTIYACKALEIKLVYMYYNGEIGMCNIELRQAVHKNALRYCILISAFWLFQLYRFQVKYIRIYIKGEYNSNIS